MSNSTPQEIIDYINSLTIENNAKIAEKQNVIEQWNLMISITQQEIAELQDNNSKNQEAIELIPVL